MRRAGLPGPSRRFGDDSGAARAAKAERRAGVRQPAEPSPRLIRTRGPPSQALTLRTARIAYRSGCGKDSGLNAARICRLEIRPAGGRPLRARRNGILPITSFPTSARRSVALTTLLLLLVAWTVLAPVHSYAKLPADTPVTSEPSVKGPFLSTPPTVPGTAPIVQKPLATVEGPIPAPTNGYVTGRVLAPDGRPLVRGAAPGNPLSPILGRASTTSPSSRCWPVRGQTPMDGLLGLRQLTERYLIRACDAPADDLQCTEDPAGQAVHSELCRARRNHRLLAAASGRTDSFSPQLPSRAIGSITVKPSAVLEGTFMGGADRTVRLLRRNDTVANRTRSDESGHFRFEVAPGRSTGSRPTGRGLAHRRNGSGFRSKLLSRQPGTRLGWTSLPARRLSCTA